MVCKMHTRHIIEMYGIVGLTVLCEVMLTPLGYFGEFLDFSDWSYKCNYTLLISNAFM